MTALVREGFVGPQAAHDGDELGRSPVTLFALEHRAAEHPEFLIKPAVDDVDRHPLFANPVQRDGELGDHHRIKQSRMDRDKRPNVLEARRDGARQHPRREIMPKMTFGEEAQIKPQRIRLLQHRPRMIELSVATAMRQRPQRFGGRLRDLR